MKTVGIPRLGLAGPAGRARLPLAVLALWALGLTPAAEARERTISGDTVVYVTPNPGLYHRWECRRLSRPREIRLEEAAALYEPCETCKPPRPGDPVEAEPTPAAAASPPGTDREQKGRRPEPGATEAGAPQPEPQEEPDRPGPPADVRTSLPVASFEELRRHQLVSLGEEVVVSDLSGTTEGRLQNLTYEEITISTRTGSRTFSEADALEILVVRKDSVAKSFWIGAAAGGVLGALTNSSENDQEPGPLGGALFCGALVGGVAALVDALMHDSVVVYRSPRLITDVSRLHVGIDPVAARSGGGVAVSLRF